MEITVLDHYQFQTPNVRWDWKESNHVMNVKFKKLHPDAVMPAYAKNGDAGLDFVAITKTHKPPFIEYKTGIAIEIPDGYVGLIFPRSSITKAAPGVSLKNSVGVIDSGYRGEILFRFEMPSDECLWDGQQYITWQDEKFDPSDVDKDDILYTPNIGDKIGQMVIVPYPMINMIEVDELSNSDRGKDGFGSTGR